MIYPSTSVGIGVVTSLIVGVFYWMYKKFRAPYYNPGQVQKTVDDGSFDSKELHSKGSTSTWMMPDNMELFYFPPSNKTKEVPMIGIHGGPGMPPKEPWAICKELPSFYLYHARGSGRSTRPFSKFPTPGKMWPGMKILEETLGLAAQVADIERIRRRLVSDTSDPDKSIVLVGHSFGGFLATLYAAEFPRHVKALVLLAPAAVLQLPSPKGEKELFQVVEEKLVERGNPQHVAEYKAFLKTYFDFGALPHQTDESLGELQRQLVVHFNRADGMEDENHQTDPESVKLMGGMAIWAAYMSMGMEHDYQPALKRMLQQSTFPVSIVHGTQDMLPEYTSRKYMGLFPNDIVEFHVFEGAGHFLMDQKQVATIIQKTVARGK